jgi:hypothetical protein
MSGGWLGLWMDAALQATAVAAGALGVALAARRSAPAFRHGLLSIALIKFLVPPFVQVPFSAFALVLQSLSMSAAPTGADAARVLTESTPWSSLVGGLYLAGIAVVLGAGAISVARVASPPSLAASRLLAESRTKYRTRSRWSGERRIR